MIVDRTNRLLDCKALAAYLRRDPSMIRKRCRVVACDVATRTQLFQLDEAVESLKGVPRRKTEQQLGEVHGWFDEEPGAPAVQRVGRRMRRHR